MGKYEVLGNYLREKQQKEMEITFEKIEDVLGFSLPKSAYKYRPWWSNDKGHVQAKDGWLNEGYHTESVDMDSHKLVFRKITTAKEEDKVIWHVNKSFNPSTFEKFAQLKMSDYFGIELIKRPHQAFPKLFDMVSEDYSIVGDAKYLSMVKNQYIPSAKLSNISEHVWMLEKVNADIRFLTFGNDQRVPEAWLKRYKDYVESVSFFFLTTDGEIKKLL